MEKYRVLEIKESVFANNDREAEKLRLETEQMRTKSEEYYAEIKREREKAMRSARAEAQAIIDNARRVSNEVSEELKQLRKQMKDAADVQGSNAKQAELRRRLNEAEETFSDKQKAPERPGFSVLGLL